MTESDDPVEVTLEDDGEEVASSTPLGQVAEVMAALINGAPDTLAVAIGPRLEVRSAGVLVKMTVTAVEADAEDVLSDP